MTIDAQQTVASTSRISSPLSAFTFDDDEYDFVEHLIECLAAWVGYLPASERNHHAEKFGLLRHSIEVGILAATNLLQHQRLIEAFPGVSLKDRAVWARALVTAALYHDVGKIFDVTFRDATSGEVWDPDRESFGEFVYREELRKTSSFGPFTSVAGQLAHVAGRGRHHEAQGRDLIPKILQRRIPDTVLVRTLAVYDAYAQRHDLGIAETLWPLPFFSMLLAAADQASSSNQGRTPLPLPEPFRKFQESAADRWFGGL